jgi:hypothetical protein
MRIPQVSERVKEAPAHALRAVFAGIGQLLLVTDRLKSNKPGEEDQVPRPRQPEPSTPDSPATPAAAPAPAKPAASAAPAAEAPAAAPAEEAPPAPTSPAAKSAGPSGNVRLLPDADQVPAAAQPAAETPAATDTPADGTPADGTPVVEAAATASAVTPAEGTPIVEPAAPAAAAPVPAGPPAAADPPIANYDQLSLASLRARLRGLTLVQVRELIVYEEANAARPDVIAMYERRVAKLEAPEG